MTETIRPEDIPADADPVCGKCKRPAAWINGAWQHAEVADAVFCGLIFAGRI